MNPSHESVTQWVQNLAGDGSAKGERAAEALWRRYASQLIAIARRAIDERTRRREDEEDVVLSVFASFCDRAQAGKFELSDRDDLWKLLVAMTTFKSRRAIARHRRQRRDARRETAAPAADASAEITWAQVLGDNGPSDEDALELVEEFERRMAQLDETCRQVAAMRLEGSSNREIARRLQTAERTIERKLQRIRQTWLAHAEKELQTRS